jgi:hypothetical protein
MMVVMRWPQQHFTPLRSTTGWILVTNHFQERRSFNSTAKFAKRVCTYMHVRMMPQSSFFDSRWASHKVGSNGMGGNEMSKVCGGYT